MNVTGEIAMLLVEQIATLRFQKSNFMYKLKKITIL